MSQFIAGLSKRHSNRLMSASRELDRIECPPPCKTPRKIDVVGESQSVSVTVNTSTPVHVHVQVSPEASPPAIDLDLTIGDEVQPRNEERSGDISANSK